MSLEGKMEEQFEELLILCIVHPFTLLPLTGWGIVYRLFTAVLASAIVFQEILRLNKLGLSKGNGTA